MLISTKGRYAMRFMIDLALRGPEEKVSLREIAEFEGISLKYLEQLVRPLTQAGLIKGMRGKNGGYCLAKPTSEIKAGDVLRAVEGTTIPRCLQRFRNWMRTRIRMQRSSLLGRPR